MYVHASLDKLHSYDCCVYTKTYECTSTALLISIFLWRSCITFRINYGYVPTAWSLCNHGQTKVAASQ